MPAELPPPEALWRAIDLYLREAYDGQPPKRDVQVRLDALRQAPAVYQDKAFERAGPADGPPERLALRLGNRTYPHMKLLCEASPDGAGYLFKCDTHDRHCCPPATSKEYPLFLQLMAANEAVARRVEAAWDAAGVATFKQFLRDDLARRRAAAQPAPEDG